MTERYVKGKGNGKRSTAVRNMPHLLHVSYAITQCGVQMIRTTLLFSTIMLEGHGGDRQCSL